MHSAETAVGRARHRQLDGSLIVRVLWSPLLLIVTIFTVVGSAPALTQITKLLLQPAETPVLLCE